MSDERRRRPFTQEQIECLRVIADHGAGHDAINELAREWGRDPHSVREKIRELRARPATFAETMRRLLLDQPPKRP